MAQLVKTVQGLAIASVKTFQGLAIASVKTIQGVDNTSGGGGSPAFVEFQSSAGSAAASTQTISITIAAGASLWVGAKWEDADRTVTVSDSGGNTYTPQTKTSQGGVIFGQTFRCVSPGTTGALTITVNFGASTNFVRAGAIEMSGVTAFDQEATAGTGTAGDAGSPMVTGNINTPNAVEVLIAMACNYNGEACTPQAGWTEVFDPNAFAIQYFVTSSASTYHGEGVLSGTSPYCITLDAFK